MKHIIDKELIVSTIFATASLILLAFVGSSCVRTGSSESTQSYPEFVLQNIDTVSSCSIVPSPGIDIIKAGNSYTATYEFSDGTVWFKDNKGKTGFDFYPGDSNIMYYADSCQLKESLRGFIKAQIVKFIQNKIANK
jgi:hypothetical protein